jgi:DNA polymerase-3 subunit delta'
MSPARPLLSTVLGQETAVSTLRRALSNDRVHHAYLFDGPDGVGKELAAFGIAQALVCERRGEAGSANDEACGECSACRRAVPRDDAKRPLHPDIVVLERGLYDPAQIGRRTPETQDLSIDQVRTLVLARASFPPHEGRARVYIVRRAEELSQAAANALLKTLEEPGRNTHFILLSSMPDALLSTIRSRTQRVRFGPLPDDVVRSIAAAHGVDDRRAEAVALLAAGSVRQALLLADADASTAREAFVDRVKRALASPDMGAALELAEEAKKSKERLAEGLSALAAALAIDARASATERSRAADVAAARHALTLSALRQLDANASPQLLVESMLLKMRSVG